MTTYAYLYLPKVDWGLFKQRDDAQNEDKISPTISVAQSHHIIYANTCFSSPPFKPDLHNPFLQSLTAEKRFCVCLFAIGMVKRKEHVVF